MQRFVRRIPRFFEVFLIVVAVVPAKRYKLEASRGNSAETKTVGAERAPNKGVKMRAEKAAVAAVSVAEDRNRGLG